ncbi:MAG: sulfite exporter TauE/SafE family protein [Candidatus Hinthialibacter antarcticus]|nr:sulfite exporter TauE/SafE family protein [Candidatus Hinthialibacter antarcticus]
MEYQYVPLVFAVGLIAGIINTLAGGGSLLTLPVLLFLGLPSPLANGTNRIAIWIQCVTAVARFRKSGVSDVKLCVWVSLPAVVGAILGAQVAVDIPDSVFRTLFAVIMLVVVAFIVWNPKPKSKTVQRYSPGRMVLIGVVFFLVGIYGGVFQAGVGYFLTAAFVLLCGLDLVSTASAKSLVVAIYTTFAMAVFIWNGQVDWFTAFILSLGNGLGGWIGGSIAVSKGEQWIRWALIVTVVAMAMKMLGIFSIFS